MRWPTLAFLVLVCVGLGALTTVAVAWIFAARYDITSPSILAQGYPPKELLANAPETEIGRIRSHRGTGWVFYRTLIGPRGNGNELHLDLRKPAWTPVPKRIVGAWAQPIIAPWELNQPWPHSDRLHAVAAFGWPYPSMYCEYESRRALGMLSPCRGSIPLRTRAVSMPDTDQLYLARVLPAFPIWRFFIPDTALFAVLWLPIVLAPMMSRRLIRRRRGLCPHCAYDLRATPVGSPCPECGHFFLVRRTQNA